MKAVVLVGGMGTRLRPLTFAVPKPLLAVGDKPILQRIIEQLRNEGCDEIALATGYLEELVQTFCGDGSRFGVRIRYLPESQPLGTAGPLWQMRDRVARDELFILMNGDILTQLNFGDFLRFARRRDYDLTVGYVRHTYQSPYGVLAIDANSEIAGITEKPEIPHHISGGVYALKGAALDHIPDREFFTVPDLIQKMRARNCPVGAYHIREFWMSVEELGHIEKANGALNGSHLAEGLSKAASGGR